MPKRQMNAKEVAEDLQSSLGFTAKMCASIVEDLSAPEREKQEFKAWKIRFDYTCSRAEPAKQQEMKNWFADQLASHSATTTDKLSREAMSAIMKARKEYLGDRRYDGVSNA